MTVPLVYSTPKARATSERLLPPGAVLEVEVQRAIVEGVVLGARDGGVVIDPSRAWVARYRRRPGKLRPDPRAWKVVEVEPYDERRR